jgi:alkaline phosphatase D
MSPISRRNFLKIATVAAVSVSAGVIGGCEGDSDSSDSSYSVSESHFPQSVLSGDPKPESIILWTRLAGEDMGATSYKIRVEVATESDMSNVVASEELTVNEYHDYCAKVKITGLSPYTYYYYRFFYEADGGKHATRIARTKTAPAADSDVTVKYTFLSCQDYIGRYYNSLAYHLEHIGDEDIDFVVHLGDYIYETTGDPSFQALDGRKITFTDTEGAVSLGTGGTEYYGAASVSNYREIYKTYRSDKVLQKFHELYPLIAIWDDHEYSDDCWGDTSTYFNEKKDEQNLQRRVNSEQVYYEFLPVDNTDETGQFNTPDNKLYGQSGAKGIYRDFRYGKHLHLILGDYRTYRPDHIIPEGAFPGKIVMDKTAIVSLFDAQNPGYGEYAYESYKPYLGPYVDMTDASWAPYAPVLVGVLAYAYMGEGLSQTEAGAKATADLSGRVSAYIFNLLVSGYNATVTAAEQLPTIDDDTYNNVLDRGIAYLHLGKQSYFSDIGSRYGVLKPFYEMYTSYLAMVSAMSGETPENVFGDVQQAWMEAKIAESDASYICFGSSVSTTSLIWDMTDLDVPADFKQQFYANVDHWDGFPNRRTALLELLGSAQKNAFIISGDIHASYVTENMTSGGKAIADFTGTSVSSATFVTMVETSIEAVIASDIFTDAQRDAVRNKLITNLDPTLKSAYSPMIFADSSKNGFVNITVSADKVEADYYLVDIDAVFTEYYDNMTALNELVEHRSFIFSNNSVSEQ